MLRSAVPNERDIGPPYRVRIPRECESGFQVDRSELVGVYMIADFTTQLCGHRPMATARRFADLEHPAYQLRALVGDTRVEKLFSSHERWGHARNVGGL